VDSGLFLQCQDLSQLPWGEVSNGEDLLLLIPRPVQEEIDHLKQDGNSRRAKRARKASSFIREIVLSENEKKILRDSNPKVEVSFPPPLIATRVKSEILDPSRPDDRIIEEALSYRETRTNEGVTLLTHDTNPILTAKRCGLPFVVIPDSWLLPPEADQRDRKIKELEQKVEEFEKSCPQVEIRATPEQTLLITVTTYEALPEQIVKEIMAEVQGLYPEATEFNKNKNDLRSQVSTAFASEYRYKPPSEFEIQKYKETDYPQWLEKVEKFFRRLHGRLEGPTCYARHSFVLSNQGIVPAENIIVEFHAVGGLLLQLPADDRDENPRLELPSPPTPQRGIGLSDLQ
jgi:PIN domain